MRVSPIELTTANGVQSHNYGYEQQDAHLPPTEPSKNTLVSSRIPPCIDPASFRLSNRVDRRECSTDVFRKKSPALHKSISAYPRPSPTYLEPVAFPSRTRACSVPPGTFPTADCESARWLSVRELRQRFFKRHLWRRRVFAKLQIL